MGALFSDPIFHKVAHSSFEKYTVADAVEEYFSQGQKQSLQKNHSNKCEASEEAISQKILEISVI